LKDHFSPQFVACFLSLRSRELDWPDSNPRWPQPGSHEETQRESRCDRPGEVTEDTCQAEEDTSSSPVC
jgi:hypothetical protein